MRICEWCEGNKFTFDGEFGAAPCGCLPLKIRKEFEGDPSKQGLIIQRHAITNDAIAWADAALARVKAQGAPAEWWS
jgi:hypothetical protein